MYLYRALTKRILLIEFVLDCGKKKIMSPCSETHGYGRLNIWRVNDFTATLAKMITLGSFYQQPDVIVMSVRNLRWALPQICCNWCCGFQYGIRRKLAKHAWPCWVLWPAEVTMMLSWSREALTDCVWQISLSGGKEYASKATCCFLSLLALTDSRVGVCRVKLAAWKTSRRRGTDVEFVMMCLRRWWIVIATCWHTCHVTSSCAVCAVRHVTDTATSTLTSHLIGSSTSALYAPRHSRVPSVWSVTSTVTERCCLLSHRCRLPICSGRALPCPCSCHRRTALVIVVGWMSLSVTARTIFYEMSTAAQFSIILIVVKCWPAMLKKVSEGVENWHTPRTPTLGHVLTAVSVSRWATSWWTALCSVVSGRCLDAVNVSIVDSCSLPRMISMCTRPSTQQVDSLLFTQWYMKVASYLCSLNCHCVLVH